MGTILEQSAFLINQCSLKENDLQNNSADENEMNEGFNKRIRFLFDEYFRTYSYLANT